MGETVRVGDVCRLAGDRTINLTTSERIARKGPYPLYAENCTKAYIDDYALEAGGTIMVAAFGQVITNHGTLLALFEEGRCSATEHVHALVPHNSADARYLWRAITTTPKAVRGVMGTSQLREISGPALLSTPLPWPHKEVRDAFVDALDCSDKRAIELAELVPAILAEGDEAFAQMIAPVSEERVACSSVARWSAGTDVPAADRAQDKPVRVEGPHGRLGMCDEALTQLPALMVGPAGRRLLCHPVLEPSHPIAEMRYTDTSSCDIPLSVLLFALRDAGVYDRLRVNGAPLDAPRVDINDLDNLQIRIGTPKAREQFAQVADKLVDRIVQAERDADENAANRYELIRYFFTNNTMPDMPADLDELPTPKGESFTKERAKKVAQQKQEEEQRRASEMHGLLLDQNAAKALGPLLSIVENDVYGLAPSDVAWELAPLAVIRACASDADWKCVCDAARQNTPGLVAALDQTMQHLAEADDLLTFMPNLSYASSLLNADQLASWVLQLDAIDPASIDGSCVRGAFMLEGGNDCMPDGVAKIFDAAMSGIAASMGQVPETAYVPWESCAGAVDSLSRTLPEATIRAQFDDFSNMLACAMVRAVELKGCVDSRGGLGAAAGLALTADEFPEWKSPLVVAALPPNPGEWIQGQPSADDPRWVLGKPPKNKANFAWIQHGLWHQAEGGYTVMLIANSALHSAMGSELNLRKALASSGRVRMVLSLPAGLWKDARPAMSIIVMSDANPEATCLMVDALDLGTRCEGAASTRCLSDADVKRLCDVCAAWLGKHEVVDGEISAQVDIAAIEAHESDLSPWRYVRNA